MTEWSTDIIDDLRSEVARLRHALDDAESIASLAMAEGLRAVEEERDETEREWVLRQAAEFCERELRQENDRLRAALAAYEEGR